MQSLHYFFHYQVYDLAGIVCHEGSVQSGHFYAVRKAPDGWIVFNEYEVSETNNVLFFLLVLLLCVLFRHYKQVYLQYFASLGTVAYGGDIVSSNHNIITILLCEF